MVENFSLLRRSLRRLKRANAREIWYTHRTQTSATAHHNGFTSTRSARRMFCVRSKRENVHMTFANDVHSGAADAFDRLFSP